jgi:DNA repair protein RadD
MQLRPYQADFVQRIYDEWSAGSRSVLGVLPTGAGKAVCVCHIMANFGHPSIIIAHRQELVGQLCLTLATFGVRHRIIGPKTLIQMVVQVQIDELGKSFYDPSAPIGVAGVDTLVRRGGKLGAWQQQVKLVVHDEAHHDLRENKWGNANAMFPGALTLGVTATPQRADGKGLGAHADGFFTSMVVGLGMRELIDMGALSEYRIFAPPNDLHLDVVPVSPTTGDYSRPALAAEVKRSHIMGDVVEHYKRIAPGKLGITFAVDVETATSIAFRYNAAGVPAEVVSAKTPDRIRHEFIRRFRNRDLLQLVNVDLFGEGFDLPALEVVSMARPTESYAVFSQQFGRACRPMPGKTCALIIDHVGNTLRHGLPDAPRVWSLDRRERGARSKRDPDVMPVTTCTECFSPYEAVLTACPWCGAVPVPSGRTQPRQVQGDLFELDPNVLAAMRREVHKVDDSAEGLREWALRQGHEPKVAGAMVKHHKARQEAQRELRDAIAWWAGLQRHLGREDPESYRRFYHTFGVDVLSAQALGRADADILRRKVVENMT